ncbi:hypothetical protein HXK74_01150 [Candidatus Gracilibacteria bacterium]|nr:hypothetical protein [Candidatus Gracilibacteria bacterium]
MKEDVLFGDGKEMGKNGLLWYLLIYIFVIQMGIVGYLWSDVSFYVLAGVNGIALAVGAWSFCKEKSKDNHPETQGKTMLESPKEEIINDKKAEDTAENEEEQEKKSDFFVRNEPEHKDEKYSLPEEDIEVPTREQTPHNIEQVRVRFNKVKSKPQPTHQEGGLARFITFLCAIIGRGGVMLLMWKEFDFIAMAIASFTMGGFVLVVYKAMNIWKKNIFSNLYFLFFVAVFAGSLLGIFTEESNSTKILIKDQISTFFAGLNGEVVETSSTEEGSGYEYQLTGTLLTGELTTGEESSEALLSGNLISTQTLNTGNNETGNTQKIQNTEQIVTGTAQASTTKSTTNIQTSSQQTTQPTPATKVQTVEEKKTDANGQVSYLSAIKHLIATYNIPLSKSKSSKFTYVDTTSPDYPYMKTALEKRMIGTAVNPNDIISCDVYMVFKGLALNWAIEKTSNLKNDYRNVAENKGLLNGCVKGAKLTAANL